MANLKQQMQEKINQKQLDLNNWTWQEFEDINGETYNHKDGWECKVKYNGSIRWETKNMFLNISVGDKSNDVFFTFDENGFKVLNERCKYQHDGHKYLDAPILPKYVYANIDLTNGIEQTISEVQSFYNWNSKVEDITDWLNDEYVPTFNEKYKGLLSEWNELHKMKNELENYDEFQYQKWYDECISNGVVNIDSLPDFDYDINKDNDIEYVEFSTQSGSVKTVYQSTWGTKQSDYLSSNVIIKPLKGGKYEFESERRGWKHNAGIKGIFTKLQFSNFMKEVWRNNTKAVEIQLQEIKESIEHVYARYDVEVPYPMENGKYLYVDGKFQLETEKEKV